MRTFVLFVGLVGVFLSGPAAAVPISWGMDPSITPVTPVLRVTLWADDGFSQASSFVDVTTFNSRITGDVSGIISPVLTLDSIGFSFDDLSLDFVIGASNLEVSIAFDGSFGWSGITGASAVLGTVDRFNVNLPVQQQLAHYSGSLTTEFGILPFDVSGPQMGSTNFTTLYTENYLGSPFVTYTNSATLDFTAIDRMNLGCYYFTNSSACSSITTVGASGTGFRHTLGSIGGVTWGIGMNPLVEGAVYTPEPSTALLVGLGLAGLSGKGRRRNRP